MTPRWRVPDDRSFTIIMIALALLALAIVLSGCELLRDLGP